jgi:hypothetical protein
MLQLSRLLIEVLCPMLHVVSEAAEDLLLQLQQTEGKQWGVQEQQQ